MIKHFELNTKGRDFAVGDIHGCFTELENKLTKLGFNQQLDRLFSVGDMVDRGPESEKVLEWLKQPFFHAVRGNHEQMAIDTFFGEWGAENYRANGGAWFLELPIATQKVFVAEFETLPLALSVITPAGKIGLVHAECPYSDWRKLEVALSLGSIPEIARINCLWERSRFESNDLSYIHHVYSVIVGHTPVKMVSSLGNVLYIDTGAAYSGGHLSVIKIN